MRWALKELHNISRPGQEPSEGDIVEVECVGGFVPQVDPVTRTAREQHQQFRLGAGGALSVVHDPGREAKKQRARTRAANAGMAAYFHPKQGR